jgi:hypothetical protein
MGGDPVTIVREKAEWQGCKSLPLFKVKFLWACGIRLRIEWIVAHVVEGYGCAVKLRKADGERLVITLGTVF